jgi:TPR repeat protein
MALLEGRNVEQDLITGESRLPRRAAPAGDPEAATLMGDLCIRSGPLPPNYTEVASWYSRAAEAGHQAPAHWPRSTSPVCLVKGVGVERDEQQAAAWLRHAAEGLPEARSRRGVQSQDRTRLVHTGS